MRSDPPLSPELREALGAEPDGAALERVWHLLGAAAPPSGAAADADWRALRDRIEAGRPRTDRPAAPPPRRARRWAVLAGIAAVAVVAAVWSAQPVVERAPVGETLAVALPDGSRVTLNSGTALRRARLLWGTADRAVALDGEAFFEVAPGDVPFVVTTHNARVAVLGTAFNVRAWAADAETSVALVEGRVEVSERDVAPEVRTLAPGDRAVVQAEGVTVEAGPADVERVAGWRGGALAFEDLPLGVVLREVERRYGVAFRSDAGVPLGARVSAFYAERPRLDALLGDLGAAAGVRFVPGPEGYRVRAGRSAPRPAPPTVQP